jgi:alpha-L-fucosidase
VTPDPNAADFAPGQADVTRLNSGDRPGAAWVSAECDVSIRPGWFYHESEDSKVRSGRNLFDLYLKSVGRGAWLILNLPPDRRGQIQENDVASLREFRRIMDQTFADDSARKAAVTSSNTRGNNPRFAPEKVLDNCCYTYWTTDDGITNADLVLEFGKPVKFNLVRLREYLPLGQRVEAVTTEEWGDGRWLEFAKATSIGSCRLIKTKPVIASKVRLRILKASASPAIAELGLFWNDL